MSTSVFDSMFNSVFKSMFVPTEVVVPSSSLGCSDKHSSSTRGIGFVAPLLQMTHLSHASKSLRLCLVLS